MSPVKAMPDLTVKARDPASIPIEDSDSESEWDDDGDREGRHLCALEDGRVVATWCVAGKTPDYRFGYKGIHFNVSQDGKSWEVASMERHQVYDKIPVQESVGKGPGECQDLL